MRIVHRIAVNPTVSELLEFRKAGVELPERFSVIEIDEADPRWPKVRELARKYRKSDAARTHFTRKEISEAQFLNFMSTWLHGYPEPADDFGYRETTYDKRDYCEACGIGLVQVQPFCFSKEPRWGSRHIFQTNWVFDEFFVRPEIWGEVFRPFQIDMRPVIDFRSGKALRSVVQLVIPEQTVPLSLGGYESEICSACKRRKYMPVAGGFFPALQHPVDRPMFRSDQYFGTGHQAYRAVIVSSGLYKHMTEIKMKGLDLAPLMDGQPS